MTLPEIGFKFAYNLVKEIEEETVVEDIETRADFLIENIDNLEDHIHWGLPLKNDNRKRTKTTP